MGAHGPSHSLRQLSNKSNSLASKMTVKHINIYSYVYHKVEKLKSFCCFRSHEICMNEVKPIAWMGQHIMKSNDKFMINYMYIDEIKEKLIPSSYLLRL